VSDLPVALARLRAAGHRPIGEVTRLSFGGVWQGCTIAYLRDPDGVILELIEPGAEVAVAGDRPAAVPRG
jgi:catechol 2,3-dioxygenase-like lactoylglutathione lyase family enzyme